MDVREAARRTLDAGSARVRREPFFEGTPAHPLLGALLATEEGVLDLTRRRARLQTLDSPNVTAAVEWAARRWPWLDDGDAEDEERERFATIVAGGRRYIGRGDRWTLAERPSEVDDPAWILDALARGGSGARRVGAEEVRGAACERWALDPVELQADPRRTLRGDVWVDGDGLIRRMTWTTPRFGRPRLQKKEPPAKLWQSVELWDFGVPVSIEVPDAQPPPDPGPILPAEVWDVAKTLWRRRAAYKRGR